MSESIGASHSASVVLVYSEEHKRSFRHVFGVQILSGTAGAIFPSRFHSGESRAARPLHRGRACGAHALVLRRVVAGHAALPRWHPGVRQAELRVRSEHHEQVTESAESARS